MSRSSIVLVTVVSLLILAGIVVGGYQLDWWLRGQEVNRTARINQDSYGRQNALVEQVLDDIKDAETPGIPAGQRVAIVAQICDSAAKLTGAIPLPPTAQLFVTKECF